MNEIEKLYEKTEMYKALKEVNDQMVARDMDKITIQVVGGFAMIGETGRGKPHYTGEIYGTY